MVNFTQWRSLVDGSEVNKIPDSGDLHQRFDSRELSLSAGDAVSTWPDESGNARDLTAGSAPTYRENVVNSNPAVEFDGVDDYLSNSHADISTPFTVVCVIRSTTNSNRHVIWNNNDGNTAAGMVEWRGGNNEWQAFNGSALSGGSNDTTAFDIISIRFDGANSDLRQNRTELAAGDLGTTTFVGGSVMGRNSNIADRYWEGEVGEFLFYDKRLSDTTLQEAESYLSSGWGVTI